MIYFIRQHRGGPIKIGTTVDIEERFWDLQAMNPYPLKILAIIRGGRQEEKKLHGKWASIRLHGEWFKPTQELMAYIENLVRLFGKPYTPGDNKLKEIRPARYQLSRAETEKEEWEADWLMEKSAYRDSEIQRRLMEMPEVDVVQVV